MIAVSMPARSCFRPGGACSRGGTRNVAPLHSVGGVALPGPFAARWLGGEIGACLLWMAAGALLLLSAGMVSAQEVGNAAGQAEGKSVSSVQWIWGNAEAARETEAGRCDFRKTFTLPKAVAGRLEVACDNHYVLRLNGRLIGMGGQFGRWDAYDVTALLVEGENSLQVRCRNEGGPAGLALRLVVQKQEGGETPEVEIVTDASWQTRLQRAGTWDPSIEARTPWESAVALGPLGCAPWGEVAAATEVTALQSTRRTGDGPLAVQAGDRILWLGSTLIERMQRHGYWEAVWTTSLPDRPVIFRNLGWSGDTVFGHARARFGSIADGFDHLETHVFAERPNWVLVAYGTNESFAGEAGLESFQEGLLNLLDTLEGTGARLVLVTPPPQEATSAVPDPSPANDNLRLYSQAIAETAKARGYPLVDLFHKLPEMAARQPELVPWTDNGLHLNDRGYWLTSQVLASELGLLRGGVRMEVDVANRTMKTSGCYADQLQLTGNEARFSVRDQTLPIAAPVATASAARWLRVTGLKPGNYQLLVDDKPVARGKAEEWANGLAIRRGPEADQATSLLQAIGKKNELYFHRWRPQNETYLFLFRKHEQGNNAMEIPQFDPLIEDVEKQIGELRVPRTRTYVLRVES